MVDQLSSDLASLKIDRDTATRTGVASRVVVWMLVIGASGVAAYRFGMPYFEATFWKTEVRLTEVSVYLPSQAAVELTSSGYVEPQRVSRVGSKIPGRVARVHVREGDHVEKGALLVELEQADREAAIQSARMQVAAAVARVATANANLAETRQ